MKRYTPRIPGALVALVLLTVLVAWFDLAAKGVGVLGAMPSGPPALTLPPIPAADYLRLLPSALAIVAILLCEGLLEVRSYSSKYGYKVDGDQMLFAYGAANLAAGFTGSLVTGNSPSRSAAMDAAGARSQLPSLVAAGTIAVVMLFFTDTLAFLPNAALAGIVANAVLSLIEVHELRELWRMRRSDFWIAAVCLLSVLALGPLRAVVIAFLLSPIDVIRRASRPETSALVEAPDGSHFLPAGAGDAASSSGLVVYRFGAPLYFANATLFLDEVEQMVDRSDHPRPLVRAGRGGDGRRGHHRRGGPAAGDHPDGQARHRLRRQPRRPVLPLVAGEVRTDGADRPEAFLPDQPARRGGVSRGSGVSGCKNLTQTRISSAMGTAPEVLRKGHTMKTSRTEITLAVVLLGAVVLTGCTHIGPKTVVVDRFDYSTAIAESWKQQTLLNIVKLRYMDLPVFVDVASIVSGYSLQTGVNWRHGLVGERVPGQLRGDRWPGRLHRPAHDHIRADDRREVPAWAHHADRSHQDILHAPDRLRRGLHSGADRQSLNGVRNRSTAGGAGRDADPEFIRALDLLREVQAAGAFGIEVEEDKVKGSAGVVFFRRDDVTADIAAKEDGSPAVAQAGSGSAEVRSDLLAGARGGQRARRGQPFHAADHERIRELPGRAGGALERPQRSACIRRRRSGEPAGQGTDLQRHGAARERICRRAVPRPLVLGRQR